MTENAQIADTKHPSDAPSASAEIVAIQTLNRRPEMNASQSETSSRRTHRGSVCWQGRSNCPIALLAICLAILHTTEALGEMSVKALSFNIRHGAADDGPNSWPHRKSLVFDTIRSVEPDFCGLQEALRFQIDEIRQAVPGYAEYGVGRDDGKTAGEYAAILFRQERWRVDRGATLWLSDTPHKPASAHWGNTIPRVVTWAKFVERRDGREVFLFNTHFDHRSQESRVRSAEFLNELISSEVGDSPLIVMGDFNAGEANPAITYLKRTVPKLVDTYRVVHPSVRDVGTFNGFSGDRLGEKIDYIFSRPATTVNAAEIHRTHQQSRYPSDHFPVSAELLFLD
jgi:endonuclease/exonuclease/phosphatase family metal-dependent hydrolase